MKTLPSNLVILAFVALFSSASLSACAQATSGAATSNAPAADPAKTALVQPLQQTIAKMKKLVATGDPDFDYAYQAKLHAQGVQDLLNQEIQNGKEPAIQQLAKDMLPTTTNDVSMLDGTIKQLKPTRPNQAFTQQQSRNIEAMNLKLQQNGASDKLTSSLDKNFTTLLLDQRQDAIDMATTYLQYGKNEGLRAYAQQLIDKAKKDMETAKAAMPK
ncbi:DUF305 domain-containing protein [Spirosoma sp. BT702]|uniref:DUF305 domain-containing protein n=1 Tax=Spirosoma profusum TaxID=2771354 RepID=A0A926Y192_9BACT|nr:DUF305 domain-containing protein [Spirosoma profusum]MBD2702092.1 DUF305 domain-containing protein [Spirosoma profusum]